MITKQQAEFTAAQYVVSLTQRVAAYLDAQARAGFVGGTFYVDTASLPQALQTKADLIAAGWSVSYDAPSQTATIS